MLAKVLVLAFVAVASCDDHGYTRRYKGVHHQPMHKQKRHYEHGPIRVQSEHESAHEPHYSPAPQSHGHAYSSQSIIQHTGHSGHSGHSGLSGQSGYSGHSGHSGHSGLSGQSGYSGHSGHSGHSGRSGHSGHSTYSGHLEARNGRNEHVAPVYQHIEEDEPAPIHHEIPAHHYQSIQYASKAPVHYEHSVHASEPHSHVQNIETHEHHAQPHHAHGHEEQSYGHGGLHHEAPVYHGHHTEEQGHESHDEPVDYYAYPKYSYEYKVEDPHTGDSKFQHEYRDGDVVKGMYSVQEPDGSVRIVEYSSDKDSGFKAIVKHTAPGQHVHIESHHEN